MKKVICLFSGETIIVKEEQATAIVELIKQGADWIDIKGELINPKAISKIGNHHASSTMNKIEQQQKKNDIMIAKANRRRLTN